jgi:uncharacterized membrane protein
VATTAPKPAPKKPTPKKPAAKKSAAKKPAAKKPAAKKAAKRAGELEKLPQLLSSSGPGGWAARKAMLAATRHALKSGVQSVRRLTQNSSALGTSVLEAGAKRRPPIQVSVDVAVPLDFAWDEWMQLEWLTEGIHIVEGIERDGDCLSGRISSRHSREWRAEIHDERENESFAWRSTEGADCAGLITFHELSDRLTRIEADLDVLPTTPKEAMALALGIANRHAEADLRRFKARLEFIDPDVYEADASTNGNQPRRQDSGD